MAKINQWKLYVCILFTWLTEKRKCSITHKQRKHDIETQIYDLKEANYLISHLLFDCLDIEMVSNVMGKSWEI